MAFTYDVFLSYSSQDRSVVQDLAERLAARGVRVWFDQWAINVGDSIPAQIENGLESSNVLVLCMSANAFGSAWSRLESYTFRFRDPLNRDRRFIPLRLDDADAPGSLAQFRHADWRENPDTVIDQLVDACRSPAAASLAACTEASERRMISLGHAGSVWSVACSSDGTQAITGSFSNTVSIWNLATGECTRILEGHTDPVNAVAYSPDGTHAITGSVDTTARVWNLATGECTRILEGHTGPVNAVAYSPAGTHAIIGSEANAARIWNLATGTVTTILEGHTNGIGAVAYSPDGTHAITGSEDYTARVWNLATGECTRILEGHTGWVNAVGYSPDGTHAITGSVDTTVRVWNLATGTTTTSLEGHTGSVRGAVYSSDGTHAITASYDNTARVWNLATGECTRILEGHTREIEELGYGGDRAITGSDDGTARIWNLATGECTRIIEGHTDPVSAVASSSDGTHAITGSVDTTARVWNLATGTTTTILEGHTDSVNAVASSSDGTHAITGSEDNTARVWNLATGECTRILAGHTGWVSAVASSSDGTHAITGSEDNTARVWNLATGTTTTILEGHTNGIGAVAYSPDGTHAITGSKDNTARIWNLATGTTTTILEGHTESIVGLGWGLDRQTPMTVAANGVLRFWAPPEGQPAEDAVMYTNAKVVLVGESQAGKSGLAIRLATGEWEHTESTVGAWATQMLLPRSGTSDDGERREIWLWDFGGQADQQLIHQLYMSDAALAVLVFDGQRDDAVPRLWHWTHALDASAPRVPRLLVGARTDVNPVRVPDADLATIRTTADYCGYLATSARTGDRCDDLQQAIIDGIDWSTIPFRSTPGIFQRLRKAIINLKDEGRVLVSAKDLRDLVPLDVGPFSADQLDAVIGLLAGPGAVMSLGFGDWVLLQPELLNSYAQAVIYTLRNDPEERGAISEERVLKGDLDFPPKFARLPESDETIVLLAMHKQLVERELCFREHDDQRGRAAQLLFPSYFRRDRPDRPEAPTTLVTYRFRGQLDTIYASLVTRLHRSDSFESGELWRDAADFAGPTHNQIGIRLTRLDGGGGRLDVYYDQLPPAGDQVLFDRHVDEHLRRTATEVERRRVYRCPSCDIAPSEAAIKRRMDNGMADIRCNACADEPKIPFLDDLERRFTATSNLQAVSREREAAQAELDNESRERLLVGEAYTIVASAGQIAREIVVSDWGLDMEVEFKDDDGRATGRRVWLQLKSGDSHLRPRKRDEARMFRLDARHAEYWADQAEPVHLLVRDSEGSIEAMDIRAELRRRREDGRWPPTQVRFAGERFDVMCVRRWRQRALGLELP